MNKVEFQFRQQFFEIIEEIKQLFLQKYFLEVSAQINDVSSSLLTLTYLFRTANRISNFQE